MVGHDDEGVELVEALVAVVLEGFEEEFGVGGELEEASAVVGDGGEKEGAGGGGSGRDRHGGIVGGVGECGQVIRKGRRLREWDRKGTRLHGGTGRARVHACRERVKPKAFPLCRRLVFGGLGAEFMGAEEESGRRRSEPSAERERRRRSYFWHA